MICSNCGTANEPGRRFCKECASPLALTCPTCGTANAADAKFCGQCASPLIEPGVSAGHAGQPRSFGDNPAPVAERRLVSVLFVDLVGFTSFSEARDAEAVRDALSRYFDIAEAIVGRYGGTIEKFIGDAVMAVWGTPAAHEDDAERAVRAALELVNAVAPVGPGVNARAGVMTGEAAVTLGATNQGMVAGDLVNTAARLQSVASAGDVLVGDATRRSTARAIAYEPAGEHELKGKVIPITAWRATRVVAEVGGRNRSDTLEAPFVGRNDELRLLKDLFHATGRERRTRLVSISAPPGLGKSRLAWELSQYVDGLVEQVWWHAGRSPAYGQGITFWALGEMIRGRAALAENDDEVTTRERIGVTVRTWIADPDEQRWIEGALLSLLGVEPMPGGPEQLFAAWRTFFERVSAQGTVALIFEDLHWADPGTLDFIDHLLDWSRGVPLFIVTLARPELIERRPDWGSGRRNFSSIALDPLPEPTMRELLEGLVPGLPEEAVGEIVRRAEGVPLYAVETVRMLVADGKLELREADGTYQPTADLSQLAVPETLTALIAARLDSLPPAERKLVSDAAVLGQSFTTAALGSVAGLTDGELQPLLRTLLQREILDIAADPRSPERGQYAFVQALIREVAYNTLARRDRRSRHLAAARYFESIDNDELTGAVAGHLLSAQALSEPGPEADAIAGQARIALRAAAERAISLGAYVQAVALIEQALPVTTDVTDRAELLERAGVSASRAGQHDRAEALLRQALEVRRALGDADEILDATSNLADALLAGYRVAAARTLLDDALEAASALTSAAEIRLQTQMARALVMTSDPAPAVDIAGRALEAADRSDMLEQVSSALVTKGGALADLGRGHEGLALLRAGWEVARAAALSVPALRAVTNISALQIARNPREAMEAVRLGMAEAERNSLDTMNAVLLINAAEAAVWTGEWEWAIDQIEQALDRDVDRLDRVWLTRAMLRIKAWQGHDIAEDLEATLEWAHDLVDPQTESNLHAVRSFAALAGRELDTAVSEALAAGKRNPLDAPNAYGIGARAALWLRNQDAATHALTALNATQTHGPAISVLKQTVAAGLAALDGRQNDALAGYREALRRWRELGVPVHEAMTGLDMAILLGPEIPDVQAAAAESRRIFLDLGARPFVERLDQALADTTRAGTQQGQSSARSPDLVSETAQ